MSVTSLVGDASEWGPFIGKYRFTRTGSTASALTVNIGLATGGFSGTPATAADVTGLPGTITIPAGAASKDLTVTVVDDALPEVTETLAVEVRPATGSPPAYFPSGSPALVSIGDNDAKLTFSSLYGYQGAVGYTVPWDQVDASQSSQSIPLPDLKVNLAGQLLSPAGATIQFARGVFAGVTFSVNTAGIANYPFNAVSMAGLTVTAVVRATGQNVTAPAVATPSAGLFFHQRAGDTQATALDGVLYIRVRVETVGGQVFEYYQSALTEGQTVGETADLVRNAMPAGWVTGAVAGNRGFSVQGYKAAGQPFDPVKKVGTFYRVADGKPAIRFSPVQGVVQKLYWNHAMDQWQDTP